MTKHFIAIFAFLLVVRCTDNRIAGGSSETETGTITGIVVYHGPSGVAGASVGIERVSSSDSPSVSTILSGGIKVTTDSNGDFTFPQVTQGEYAVAAKFSDSLSGLVRVNVTGGDTSHAVIRLTQLTPANQDPPTPGMVWSAVTNEIIFVSKSLSERPMLKAVNAATQQMRTLDSSSYQYGTIVLSKDARTLYYCAATDSQMLNQGIFRVAIDNTTTAPQRIAPDSPIFSKFAFFPDSSWIAFREGEILPRTGSWLSTELRGRSNVKWSFPLRLTIFPLTGKILYAFSTSAMCRIAPSQIRSLLSILRRQVIPRPVFRRQTTDPGFSGWTMTRFLRAISAVTSAFLHHQSMIFI